MNWLVRSAPEVVRLFLPPPAAPQSRSAGDGVASLASMLGVSLEMASAGGTVKLYVWAPGERIRTVRGLARSSWPDLHVSCEPSLPRMQRPLVAWAIEPRLADAFPLRTGAESTLDFPATLARVLSDTRDAGAVFQVVARPLRRAEWRD